MGSVSEPAECWVLLGTDKQRGGAQLWLLASLTWETGAVGELSPPFPCLCVAFQPLNVRLEGAEHSFWENSVCLTGQD